MRRATAQRFFPVHGGTRIAMFLLAAAMMIVSGCFRSYQQLDMPISDMNTLDGTEVDIREVIERYGRPSFFDFESEKLIYNTTYSEQDFFSIFTGNSKRNNYGRYLVLSPLDKAYIYEAKKFSLRLSEDSDRNMPYSKMVPALAKPSGQPSHTPHHPKTNIR